MPKKYWLMKSEPEHYSFEQLKKDGATGWTAVRNYQARNFMRDQMKLGDGVLFYHSNADPAAIVGLAEVCHEGHPDPTQFEPKSEYYDPKSKPESPTWIMVGIKYLAALKHPLTLAELKKVKGLSSMPLLKRGMRLSVQPVSGDEWKIILKLGQPD